MKVSLPHLNGSIFLKKIYTKVILNLSIFNFQRLKNIFSNIFNKILFIIGYDVNFRQISKFEIQAKNLIH